MPDEAVGSQLFTVVGGDDDQRILTQGVGDPLQEPREMGVEPVELSVVSSGELQQIMGFRH